MDMVAEEPFVRQLWQQAQRLGFSMLGIVPAWPARRLQAYLRWIDQEMHGSMGYLARPDRVARRQDLQLILPGARALVCVGLAYYTGEMPPGIANDPGRGRISNYAWGQVDYHDLMTPRLEALAAWLQAQTAEPVRSRVYVDTGAILERDHAETAGLGFTGKNTMLIAPRSGSWFFLGEILTTLPLVEVSPEQKRPFPTCGRCRRCLDACPTNAFPEPYVLDARRCISYLTIEHKGWIPRELRPLMGNWIYGCDICQEVCPFNRFAAPTAERAFAPVDWESAAPPLPQILALTEAAFQQRFAHSPIRRIKRRGLLRNACVAAGNWGSPTAVPFLTPLLTDPDPLLRGHAAWALRQIGGHEAETAVARALRQETDPDARAEMSN